ncbi:hypothetical protein ABZX51_000689 [Aspergillus tubingensis]
MANDTNDLAPPFGYPVRRNGTCYDTENDCGSTWGPYRECCPKDAGTAATPPQHVATFSN